MCNNTKLTKAQVLRDLQIVDFAIWLLFSREKKTGERPKHLLCDGFRRDFDRKLHGKSSVAQGQIPGLFAVYTNNHVRTLKEEPWPQLLLLLGKAGERIMIDLLLDCSIFRQVRAGRGNYEQLSGIPVSELDYRTAQSAGATPTCAPDEKKNGVDAARGPAEITFVRSRMLYARAALNARGLVHFGLRHIRKQLTSFGRLDTS
jgi:telomerase reverse transcriptase